MPDDTKSNAVQQDGKPETSPPPIVEQPIGSPNAAEVAKSDVNTKIQNLGAELHKAERWMIWLTGAIAFFGLCTVIVGFLQWNAMRGQLTEMQSGGVLLRQQVVGTTAAVMNLGFSVDAQGLRVVIDNRGHTTAPASAHFVVKRISLPALNPIGTPIEYDIKKEPVLPNGTEHGFDRTFPIDGLGVKEWEDEVRKLKEAVSVEVSSASYEEGYGGTNAFEHGCYMLIVVGWGMLDNGEAVGNPGRVNCSRAVIQYRDSIAQRSLLQAKYQNKRRKPN